MYITCLLDSSCLQLLLVSAAASICILIGEELVSAAQPLLISLHFLLACVDIDIKKKSETWADLRLGLVRRLGFGVWG